MNLAKKALSLGTSAALVASLLATVVAPSVAASTAVTGVGSIPRGGTSTTAATFVFTENAVNSFPTSGGTLIVTLTDNAGGPTVHFSGTPVLAADGSLGASITLDSSGNFFTISASASSATVQEQISVSGLKISADAGAALGAMNANLGGTLAGGVTVTTATATGALQAPLGAGAGTVLVNVTSACGFDATNTDGQVNFSDVSDARNITSAVGGVAGTGLQNIGFAAGTSTHGTTATITQTVPNCSTALASPGTVANVVSQGSTVTEQGNNPTTVNPGEQNQAAGWTSITENAAGYVPVGTLTYTLSATGVQFSAPPVVSSLTAALAAPSGLTATATSGGSLVAGTYNYEIAATTGNGGTIPSASASITTTSTGGIALSWTAVPGATGYIVYGRSTYLKIASTTGTTFIDTGSLTPAGAVLGSNTATVPGPSTFTATPSATGGTLIAGTYFYQVQAILPAPMNYSTPSAFASATFASGATNSVVLSWSPVPGATGYNVFGRPSTAVAGTKINTSPITLLTYTDDNSLTPSGAIGTAVVIAVPAAPALTAVASSGALAANTYYYVVTALDGNGSQTNPSVQASAVVTGTGSVALSWTGVVGAASYDVYRGTTAGVWPTRIATAITTTSFTDIGGATVAASPPTNNGTGGSATGAAVLGSGVCSLSFSRTSCSVSVTTASTVPSTITLGSVAHPIMLDVASTVPAGTAVNVVVTSSPAINVNISSDTIAYVARVAVGVAAQPVIYINYNQQNTGLITIKEQAPGFFVGGTGNDNTFGLCLVTGESFTFAPYAVVTTGDLSLLNGLVGGSSVAGTLYTDTDGNACVRWTVYTASTVASTVEIRGTDSTGAVLPTGATNGPSLSVPAALAPGTTQGVILIGTYTNVVTGVDVDSGAVDVSGTPAFSSLVSMATRAFKSGVVVAAVSQPTVSAGTVDTLAGNLTISETLNGQFKPGQMICVAILPRTSNGVRTQDTFIKTATTNDLPVIATNSASGLLTATVATPGCPPTFSSLQYYYNGDEVSSTTTTVPGPFLPNPGASFSFMVTQQSFGTLGVITISNIHLITTADAVVGTVLVDVAGDTGGGAVQFESVVSNAKIGAAPHLNIAANSALGLNPTKGYTMLTPKYQAVGKYVTWKFTGGPALAGQRVNILVAKHFNGAWGGPVYYKSAWADANGIVTFAWTSKTAAAINVRVQWPGTAAYAVSTSKALGAYFQ